MTGCLTFDLQADLVLSCPQNVACHAGVGALVLHPGPFYLQSSVDINPVLAPVQATALSVFKPENSTLVSDMTTA